MNKIDYLRKHFSEILHVYIGNKINIISKYFYLLDWLFAFLLHGASINDYFAYGFYKTRYNGRREFITYRQHKKIQNKCNKIIEDRQLCRDKVKFNNCFNNYLGRQWLDIDHCTFDEFKDFVSSVDSIFVKDNNGFCGRNIEVYKSEDVQLQELYMKLKGDDKHKYIIEEKLLQTGELAEFHPWSVNTIRIVTIYDDRSDVVHFMKANLRIGNKKNKLDNFHHEGIAAHIDIDTGVITSLGYDKYNNTYINHPVTNKQIVGFVVPYWQKCKQHVEDIARLFTTVRYVGWDIVLQDNGSFLLIEANDNADHDIQQLHNGGLWKQYRKIMQTLS